MASIDNNLQYSKSASGNYLTTRKKSMQAMHSPAFASNNITLSDELTGQVILIPTTGANSTITLPTASAGLTYKLVCGADSGAHTIIIAGTFKGSVIDAGVVAPATGTAFTIANSTFKIGDYVELLCDGTNWLVLGGFFVTAAAVTVS